MIVAAGLGTRLRPLTELRAKAALPVAGIPLVAYPLALLASVGVRETVINLHHLPDSLRSAAEAWRPPGMTLHFSHEARLLHTGGAIRRVADFLRESDPCIVLGGDMLVDLDLAGLLERHRGEERTASLVLRRDPRAAGFGSIGVGAEGDLRRIGRRFDRGGELDCGIYTWVNVFSRKALERLPARSVFNHLDDWLAPLAQQGERVVGECLDPQECIWEPVGTLQEYLAANFARPTLSYLDVAKAAAAAGVRFGDGYVAGPGVRMGADARLARVVVWEDQEIAPETRAHDGVFANGLFYPCRPIEAAVETRA